MINNLVTGVTKGFEKRLEITGVGYKAAVAGQEPAAVARLQPRHRLPDPGRHRRSWRRGRPSSSISGIDKREVGQVAAEIRALRPPEPYKGKGVKYAGEFIFRKEGKKK